MTCSSLGTIQDKQDAIIQNFQLLAGDRETMLHYIIELGEQMPPLAEQYKTEAYRISGCLSAVWLQHRLEGGQLFFEADSNTAITKGLISLLINILSGQPAQAILQSNLYFIERIGLHQFVGSQRSGGLASMLQRIKLIAAHSI
jgi:cysteine desulfuration protein SufE